RKYTTHESSPYYHRSNKNLHDRKSRGCTINPARLKVDGIGMGWMNPFVRPRRLCIDSAFPFSDMEETRRHERPNHRRLSSLENQCDGKAIIPDHLGKHSSSLSWRTAAAAEQVEEAGGHRAWAREFVLKSCAKHTGRCRHLAQEPEPFPDLEGTPRTGKLRL